MNEQDLVQLHSCFVTDVVFDKKAMTVQIKDSNRMRYSCRLDTDEKAANFKEWLDKTFLAAKAQTLTVFRYHEEGSDPDVEVVIDKFLLGGAAGQQV